MNKNILDYQEVYVKHSDGSITYGHNQLDKYNYYDIPDAVECGEILTYKDGHSEYNKTWELKDEENA